MKKTSSSLKILGAGCLIALLAGPMTAQVIPGYERASTDLIHNKADRAGMERVEEEIEGIEALDEATWKSRALTWGFAEFDDATVQVSSQHDRFYDMQKVRTKKTRSELSASEPIVSLDLKKRNRDLWLTLPERAGGQEVRCEMNGEPGSELFGVFRLTNSGFVCLSRAAG